MVVEGFAGMGWPQCCPLNQAGVGTFWFWRFWMMRLLVQGFQEQSWLRDEDRVRWRWWLWTHRDGEQNLELKEVVG